jgi:hypothetical protein
MTEIYIETDTYRRLVDALAAIEPCAFTGDRETQILFALGEIADVWPASVLNPPDATSCTRR